MFWGVEKTVKKFSISFRRNTRLNRDNFVVRTFTAHRWEKKRSKGVHLISPFVRRQLSLPCWDGTHLFFLSDPCGFFIFGVRSFSGVTVHPECTRNVFTSLQTSTNRKKLVGHHCLGGSINHCARIAKAFLCFCRLILDKYATATTEDTFHSWFTSTFLPFGEISGVEERPSVVTLVRLALWNKQKDTVWTLWLNTEHCSLLCCRRNEYEDLQSRNGVQTRTEFMNVNTALPFQESLAFDKFYFFPNKQ